ncbi:sporulation integral membrane protein YlbJ [Bacillus marinisedimentorum]|uniref:sporulation integral membrane protein YlbJ n=1 Tax=Bacillus marinisedimentorum TaxID=1821260 RepID=UPI0009F38263|nr:sporulation integral membrane protein YlbJ [Bacillus marinisedimentorum]
MNRSKMKTILMAAFGTLMAGALISFPKASLEASIRGLDMWWEVVFPSLLPFFIVSEILISFGVVNFLGVLLEPLMRPLFRVPGAGGFVWAMGIASGFPAGAKLTARLRQEKQLTAIEAERLVSFTNSSNPLFIFGVVAVGFFHNPELGMILAVSHYLGNVCVGLVMRFYGRKEERSKKKNDSRSSLKFKEAFEALHLSRLEEKRPFGSVLGDAVTSSIQTLLLIGGFIILFSVLNKLLELLNIIGIFAWIAAGILGFLHVSTELSGPLISGLFEITLGTRLTSQAGGTSLHQQVIIASFILAFNGFSVQAQVASILAETDIRFAPFFIARFLHGIFAAAFAFVLWEPLYEGTAMNRNGAVPVWSRSHAAFSDYWTWLGNNGALFTLIALIIYCILQFWRPAKFHK